MLVRKYTRRDYDIPGVSPSDDEAILAWRKNPLQQYKLMTSTKLSSDEKCDTYILILKSVALCDLHNGKEKANKQLFINGCNDHSVAIEKRMELAKYLLLHEGESILSKLNFSNDEKKVLTDFFQDQLMHFYLPQEFDTMDAWLNDIKNIKHEAGLRRLAYDFLGRWSGIPANKRLKDFLAPDSKITFDTEELKIECLQDQIIASIRLTVDYLREFGFAASLKPLAKHFPHIEPEIYSYPKDETKDETNDETNDEVTSQTIEIRFGSGFFRLTDFFTGSNDRAGYPLFPKQESKECIGAGIPVTTVKHTIQDITSANQVSQYFDQPCLMWAEIDTQHLKKLPLGAQAGLLTENRQFLKNIRLHNLQTKEYIVAENYDELRKTLAARNDYSPSQTRTMVQVSPEEELKVAFNTLFNELNDLETRGTSIGISTTKGAAASKLASEIRTLANQLYGSPNRAKDLPTFEAGVKALLEDKDTAEKMAQYRICWPTLRKNILAAVTIIGALVIAARLLYTKCKYHRFLLFGSEPQTTCEKKMDAISAEVNEIKRLVMTK